MRRFVRLVALVVLFVVAFAAAWVRLPYYAVGPGPADEVDPLIDVQGVPRYASRGKLIMTTISWRQVTALDALFAWIDDSRFLVSEEEIYPPGLDRQVEEERAISQMDQSKIDASVVVLEELFDYPEEHGDGALVQSVGPRCPAEGELFPGDLVLTIDGEEIGSQAQAQAAIDGVPIDDPVRFRVQAGGEEHDVAIVRGDCPGYRRPLLGISMVDRFPFEIEIASGDVGGPSAGLMFALGLYDALTPADLTDGRTIAGTGVITAAGRIEPIGGIADKVIGADDAGASVFLLPRENMDELDGVDTGDLRLIPVGTFDQAVAALEAA